MTSQHLQLSLCQLNMQMITVQLICSKLYLCSHCTLSFCKNKIPKCICQKVDDINSGMRMENKQGGSVYNMQAGCAIRRMPTCISQDTKVQLRHLAAL